MPGNFNFTEVRLNADGDLEVTGVNREDKDVECVNVTMVIKDRFVMNEFDHNEQDSPWTLTFTNPSDAYEVSEGDDVFLIGAVLRKKDASATCACPPPAHIVWSEYVTVTKA